MKGKRGGMFNPDDIINASTCIYECCIKVKRRGMFNPDDIINASTCIYESVV